jgi:hypothetical protein
MRSEVINFRIQPSTKAALKKAAAASGRTVSAEAEYQLHRALSDIGQGVTHAVFAMIGKTVDGFLAPTKPETGEPAIPARRKWWDDPRLFDQVTKLCAAALELLRPHEPSQEDEDPVGARSAQFAIEATLREIQTADLSVPFDRRTNHQKWLALMKQGLGDLADRPAIWGQTAAAARKLKEAAAPVLEELIPLAQKSGRTPDAMTTAETDRLAALRRDLERVVKSKSKSKQRRRKT